MTGAFRLLIACALALVTAGVALPLLLRIAKPLGLLDVPGGRKLHHGAVAMVGGLAATCGLLVAGFWLDGMTRFERALLVTAAALVVVGAIDDRRNLSVRVRVLIQVAIILIMVFTTGVHVRELGSLYGFDANLGWFGIPFTVVALVGLLNAFNLVDGIDGLAIGLTWVAIAAILLTTGVNPAHGGTAALLVLLACALVPVFAANLGWFGPRAKCFLGDAGSTLIGYIVGWALIAYGQQPSSGMSPVGTLWCVALPILDTLAVMYRRAHQRRNPFKPDRGHIHHLLMNAGYGPRATLLILVAVAGGLWCVGVLIRHLNLGAGSNMAAFCAMIVAYALVTERIHARQAARSAAARAAQPEAGAGELAGGATTNVTIRATGMHAPSRDAATAAVANGVPAEAGAGE